jgi:hypothetical protein
VPRPARPAKRNIATGVEELILAPNLDIAAIVFLGAKGPATGLSLLGAAAKRRDEPKGGPVHLILGQPSRGGPRRDATRYEPPTDRIVVRKTSALLSRQQHLRFPVPITGREI